MRTFLLAIFLAGSMRGASVQVELQPAFEGLRCGAAPRVVEAAPGPLAIDVQDCWAEPVMVAAGADRVVVRAWPAATVIGEFAVKPQSDLPKSVAASFVDAAAKGKDIPEFAVRCNVEGPRWRCTIPARRALHLKLAAPGFAPVYLWDVQARDSAEISTGIHDLTRGGSVLGRVITAAGRPAAKAYVHLVPVAAAEQAASEGAATTVKTRASAAGVFQFTGVDAGLYRVVSHLEGFADAVADRIEVREGTEARVDGPLVHVEAATLEVSIQPPVNRAQEPWRVKLERYGDRLYEARTIAEGSADLAGFWTPGKLEPGRYVLRVLDRAGSAAARETVEIRGGGSERVFVTITSIEVVGRIFSGDQGIAVDLEFDRDGQRVQATSDAEGRFIASFPKAGEWTPTAYVGKSSARVLLERVTIESGEELVLKIPGGSIHGRVVRDDGTGTWAQITILGEKHKLLGQVPADDEGAFEMPGVPAGSYTIKAEAEEATAGPVPVVVEEDESTEIELRLARMKTVRGSVITPRGTPASGAVVRIFDRETGGYDDRIADGRGAFSFTVRGHARVFDLIVLAPPHPIANRELVLGNQSDRVEIQLASQGATLRVYVFPGPPWPTIAAGGVPLPMRLFFLPEFGGRAWTELVNGAFELNVTPGPYTVCHLDLPCQTVQLAPGTIGTIDYSPAAIARFGK